LNDLQTEQENDDFIKNISTTIETESPRRNYLPFTLVENILYRQIMTVSGAKLVPVIPMLLVQEIIEKFHRDPIRGHLGELKTFLKTKDRFWWNDMRNDIKEYVKTCFDCLTKKMPKTGPVKLLQPVKVGGPFETIGVDIFGPLVLSDKGNKYIITATDYLTKWVEAIAIPSQTALDVALFLLNHIICRHGAPMNIISDRGTQFLSEVVEQLLIFFSIVHNKTSGYHPQTNALTEKFNETLANMLSMYTDSKQTDWDKYLTMVIFAYNSSVQSTTKYSPFHLVYGRQAKFPNESIYQITNTMGIETPNEYAICMRN